MKYLELSTKELNDKCFVWAKDIYKDYQPDLVIYIARAGYLYAVPMNKVFNAKILGIGAVRSGNRIKEFIGPIMSICPRTFRKILATLELKSGVHNKKTERDVIFHSSINDLDCKVYKKILIVDDAVDTGYSMKKVLEKTVERFINAEVRTACFNMSCKPEECVIKIDYVLLQGYSVKTPFSKDSREYTKTKKKYYQETKNEYV